MKIDMTLISIVIEVLFVAHGGPMFTLDSAVSCSIHISVAWTPKVHPRQEGLFTLRQYGKPLKGKMLLPYMMGVKRTH